jgi:hypothetical protein
LVNIRAQGRKVMLVRIMDANIGGTIEDPTCLDTMKRLLCHALYGSSCDKEAARATCRMDLPGPTTSVGTRTDYPVGPWDYPACATRHLKAWSTRTTQE